MKKGTEEESRVNIGYFKCKRVRRIVLDAYSNAFTTEFYELEASADELLRINPGSIVNIAICIDDLKKGRRIFKRIFVCWNAFKKGWKAGCRPIIGPDGCFLKTKFKGELLVALRRDGNEQNFLIAWACVKSETKLYWVWFLTLLKGELELRDGSQFTFISDRQKV